MKITEIVISQKRTEAVRGMVRQEYCMYLFRSPVIFSIDGVDKVYSGCTAIIYRSGSIQYYRGSLGKGLKYDMVCFHAAACDRQYIAQFNNIFDKPVKLPDDFMMSSAIKSMKIYTDMYGYKRDEYCDLYIRAALIGIAQAYRLTESEKNHIPKYPALQNLRRHIYDNPMIDWSVSVVCRKLSISKTYFHRLYTEAFGTTFTQDVIESRLLYATQLLAGTELSVSEIAEKCGYESDSYFMRQFKKHRGCTPTEYRRKKDFKDDR